MIPPKLLIFLILLCLVSFAASSNVKQLPRTLEYRLELRIDFSTEKLYAKCEITISNNTNQPIEQIPILLYRLLTVKSVENENNIAWPFSQKVISDLGGKNCK